MQSLDAPYRDISTQFQAARGFMSKHVGTMVKLAAGVIAFGAVVAWATPARAECGILGTNQTLYTNQTLQSCDGRVTLAMQGDGNLVVYDGAGNVLWASMVYYRSGVLQNLAATPADQCVGRCGAGCNGWMPFGGGIYTSECYAHDLCVAQHGHVGCIPEFIPAAVSYVVQVAVNLLSAAWDAITSFFDWW